MPSYFALVNSPEPLPLLQSPDAQAAQASAYPLGTVVQILEDMLPYAYVRTVDNEGYMEREALLLDGEEGKRTLFGIRDMRVSITGEEYDFYAFPDKTAPLIVNTTPLDFIVLGVAGDWFYVSVSLWSGGSYVGFVRPDDRTGYGIGTKNGETTYGIIILPEDMETVPLYDAPSVDATILAEYFHTTQVELPAFDSEQQEEYVKVLVDGRAGYIQSSYISVIHRENASVW